MDETRQWTRGQATGPVIAAMDENQHNRNVAQNKRFHQLRAAAASRDDLSRLSEGDFAEWLTHARTNGAERRHGKAAAKEWQKLLREAEAEARRRAAAA